MAMSIQEKMEYWMAGAEDNLATSKYLLDGNQLLFSAFLSHLAVEKTIKAFWEKEQKRIIRVHDLVRLSVEIGIYNEMKEEWQEILAELTPLNTEARYPSYKKILESSLTIEKTKKYHEFAKEFLAWAQGKLMA